MEEFKRLVTISIVSENEKEISKVGEVQGIFDDEVLRLYIYKYGWDELSKHLTFLHYQLMTTVKEVEKAKNKIEQNSRNR